MGTCCVMEKKYLAHYACILAELHPWPTPHLFIYISYHMIVSSSDQFVEIPAAACLDTTGTLSTSFHPGSRAHNMKTTTTQSLPTCSTS
jgi:hypothetical protein